METRTNNPDNNTQAFSNRTLGEIAVDLPGATAVFRRHKLDFCCGGKISLKEAAEKRNLDLPAILRELAMLQKDTVVSNMETSSELMDSIIERYHNVHRRELPELIRLAVRVTKVHKEHPEVPQGLVDTLAALSDKLLEHMDKEEQVLFTMMKTGGNPMIHAPISMMRHEHNEHGELLHELSLMTNHFEPPEEACNTWRALYSGLSKLANDLTEHIHLENNVLFERFEK